MSESRSDLSFDMGWGFIRGKVSRKNGSKHSKKNFMKNIECAFLVLYKF